MIFGRVPKTYIVYIHAVSSLCWCLATFVKHYQLLISGIALNNCQEYCYILISSFDISSLLCPRLNSSGVSQATPKLLFLLEEVTSEEGSTPLHLAHLNENGGQSLTWSFRGKDVSGLFRTHSVLSSLFSWFPCVSPSKRKRHVCMYVPWIRKWDAHKRTLPCGAGISYLLSVPNLSVKIPEMPLMS